LRQPLEGKSELIRRGSQSRIGAHAKAWGVLIVVAATMLPSTVSHAAIAAPVIKTPGANSLQASATPMKVRISGTAVSGSDVTITDALEGLNLIKRADGGNWAVDVNLSDGGHTITATATKDGETSLPTSVSFDVDAIKPTLTLTSPKTDAYLFSPGEKLAFAGEAADAQGIFAIRTRYYRLDTLVLEKLATCEGCNSDSAAWSDEPTLQPGYYVMTATAIDRAGNQSDAGRRTFTTALDRAPGVTLPEAPEVPGGPDSPIPTSPLPGSVLPGAENPITFSGRSEPNSEVEAFETKAGLGPLGSVDSDNKGKWRLKAVLPSGSYSIQFRAVDEDGNPSPWTSVLPFKVDANRPLTSIVTENNTLFLPLQPVVLQGRTTDNRGVRAIIVEYWLGEEMVDRNLATCLGCTRRDVSWSDTPTLTTAGYYYAIVKAVDITGNKSFVQSIHFLWVA
jgi:hypothetical protein